MTVRKNLLIAVALLVLIPVAGQAVERTVLLEKFTNGW
jgi:hypothetical protein